MQNGYVTLFVKTSGHTVVPLLFNYMQCTSCLLTQLMPVHQQYISHIYVKY